jgi:hypothetical protein
MGEREKKSNDSDGRRCKFKARVWKLKILI